MRSETYLARCSPDVALYACYIRIDFVQLIVLFVPKLELPPSWAECTNPHGCFSIGGLEIESDRHGPSKECVSKVIRVDLG